VPRDAPAGPPWTQRRMLRWLSGRRVAVAGRTVPIDGATLTCMGIGRPSRVGRVLAWTRFRCVQPTFPAGSVVGPDVLFFVTSTSRDALAIEHARLTTY
jgi:hypothetical protein